MLKIRTAACEESVAICMKKMNNDLWRHWQIDYEASEEIYVKRLKNYLWRSWTTGYEDVENRSLKKLTTCGHNDTCRKYKTTTALSPPSVYLRIVRGGLELRCCAKSVLLSGTGFFNVAEQTAKDLDGFLATFCK